MKLSKYKQKVRITFLGISAAIACAAAQAQTMNDAVKNIERHHFKEALSSLHTILKNEPGNAAAYYQIGKIYLLNSLEDSARYFFEKGISTNGNEPLNYVGMGRYYLDGQDKAKAKEQFQKAMSLGGDKNAPVMQQIADAYVSYIVTDEGPWAVQLAEKAKSLDKKNLSYTVTLGDAYRLIPGRSNDGLDQYRAAADADKKYALPLYRQGQLFYKVKNTTQGENFMNQALAADPAFAPVYMDMAEAEFEARHTDKAIEDYKKYIDIAGFAPAAETTLGGYYYYNKQYNEAKTELQKAAVYDPTGLIVMRINAYSDFYLKDYKKGLEEMKKYFDTVKPENIIGQDYMHYGFLLGKNGQDSAANDYYKKGIEKDSAAYDLYDTLAASYGRLKKYEDAAKMTESKLRYQKAHSYKVNPQDYYSVARNYYMAGNYALADSNLALVNQYYPTWISGFKFRAQVNMKLDPKSEKGMAIPYWNKVVELGEADAAKNSKDLIDAYNFFAEYNYNLKKHGVVMCYANKILALDASNAGAKKLIGYLPKGTKEDCPTK
jgi:tetratricopeptide (TPR) repeat protein